MVIKQAYRRLARKFHPDKYVQTNPQECDSATKFVIDPTKQFTEITEANEVLSNPLQRRLYDCLIGVRDKSDSSEQVEAAKLKREEALHEIANMQCTHDIVKKREVAKKGVVIASARYGNLRGLSDSAVSAAQQDWGSTVDVKLPLQCMVEESVRTLPNGEVSTRSVLIVAAGTSKANLAGFYDPCLAEEKQLFVRYMYGNMIHEVTVGDTELLKIPCAQHHSGNLVVFDRPEEHEARESRREKVRRKKGLPAGRFAQERAAMRAARRTRSHVVSAGIVALAGYALHKRFPSALPRAWAWLQSTLSWDESEAGGAEEAVAAEEASRRDAANEA